MTSTGYQRFSSISQAGSDTPWTDLSNLTGTGEARVRVSKNGVDEASNTISLALPGGVGTLPNDASFESMQFRVDWEKLASISAGATLRVDITPAVFNGVVSVAPGGEASGTLITADGDRSYWGLQAYTAGEVLSLLKAGTLKFTLRASNLDGSPLGGAFIISEPEVNITYSIPVGRGGAIVASTL